MMIALLTHRLELIITLLIPAILSFVEITWTDRYLDRAVEKAFSGRGVTELYFFRIITAVRPIRGLTLCMIGFALDLDILLNHSLVARVLGEVAQQAGFGEAEQPIELTVYIAALLVIGIISLVFVVLHGRDIFLTELRESINILIKPQGRGASIEELRESKEFAKGRWRRAFLAFIGAANIVIPLIIIFLLLFWAGG